MIEVCDQKVTNKQFYMNLNTDPIENIMYGASRPIGRHQQTRRHTYIHALQVANLIPEDAYPGKLADW
eukprot:13800326-Ditylum_brightwellii.AAC.1